MGRAAPRAHTADEAGVPNVAASMVPASSMVPRLPKHQAFMALENSEYPVAINTGTDRDLSKNWKLLQQGHHANSPGVACPRRDTTRPTSYIMCLEGN